MSGCRFSVFLCLWLLVGGAQSGIAQQNFGVVQGRLAEGIKEVSETGRLTPRKVGTSLALAVPVSVNGSKTTWWIVDTGAPLCLIDPSFSTKLGLQADNKVGSFPVTMVNNFQLGTFQCNGIACVVRSIGELKSVQLRNEGGSFDKAGVIGVNLLAKYGGLINCRTLQIFLSPSANMGMSRQKYEELGFTYVPMNVTSQNRLEVTGTLGGKEFSFFLDTGAYSTIVDNSIRNEVKLPFFTTNAKIVGPFHDFGRDSRYTYGTATEFKLGNYDASGARIGATTLNLHESPGSSHRFAGFIGMDFLFSRSAIIDVGGRGLYLKPSARAQ
jgi:predicted aspartyl protease